MRWRSVRGRYRITEVSVAQPLLRSIRAEVPQSIGAITIALNERKITTTRGARWHVSSVMNLLARAQRLDALR